jgi:hypothetical protein
VAGGLAERAGYTQRRLENSLADLVRRHLLGVDAAELMATPLRDAGLLPKAGARSKSWLSRALGAVRRRRQRLVSSIPRVARATPLDYDSILDHLEAGKAGT